MSYTVLDIVTDSARLINLIDANEDLSPEDGQMCLVAINDMMSDLYADGIELGWYTQTSLTNTAPIRDSDARCVKLVFARELSLRKGLTMTLPEDLKTEIDDAEEKLAKRTTEYFESDMSGLPLAQGAYWGGGRA